MTKISVCRSLGNHETEKNAPKSAAEIVDDAKPKPEPAPNAPEYKELTAEALMTTFRDNLKKKGQWTDSEV